MPTLADLELAYYAAATASGTGANAGAQNSNGKAEDSTHASGDMGDFTLGIRNPAAPVAATNANLDYTGFMTDAEGKQIVQPYAPTDFQWQTAAPIVKTDTSNAVVKAAAAAGIRNYVSDVTVCNTAVTGVLVNILDGATVIHTIYVPATSTVAERFYIPLKGTAATAVNIAAQSATTSVIINAQGFIGI